MADAVTSKSAAKGSEEVDYSLANPDTVTKYKDAATIAQKVLSTIEKAAVGGEKLVSLCEKGDKLLEEEAAKIYKGKKISKGIAFPTTISPSDIVTPYSPLLSDEKEAGTTLRAGQIIKIQLGAHIDGFPAIVGSTIIVRSASGEAQAPTPTQANILLATYYCNELLLRLLLPPSVSTAPDAGEGEKKEKKPYSQSQINSLLKKICEAFGTNLVESTTSYQFERNEIEGKKRIILNPGEGVKGEGTSDVGEAWGVEVAISGGSGKVKTLEFRSTIHRKTGTTFLLKRDTSRKTFSEVVKKFGNFPFSLRQLENERTAKMGIVECVRSNILRQYEVEGEKDAEKEVARLFSTIIITKNGITQITKPTTSLLDLAKNVSDKKITDEEILKILETPLNKAKSKKAKNKTEECPA